MSMTFEFQSSADDIHAQFKITRHLLAHRPTLVLTVRGTSVASGKKTFVRNRVIEGAAPDLPRVEIDV